MEVPLQDQPNIRMGEHQFTLVLNNVSPSACQASQGTLARLHLYSDTYSRYVRVRIIHLQILKAKEYSHTVPH